MMSEQVIILTAGNGGRMGGINKSLLPIRGKPILDYYIEKSANLVVVVGYNYEALLSRLPRKNYVINRDWRSTNSAYSLKLALESDASDSVIIDGDTLFLGEIDEYGFYCCRPDYHFLTQANTFEKCSALQFIGVAKTTKKQNEQYLRGFTAKNNNDYWCEVYRSIKIIETKDKWYEIDTWEDYRNAV